MNAHPLTIDTAPALIDKATDLMARIHRLAPHTRPTLRLRLRDELALVERVVEDIEGLLIRGAQFTLAEVKPKRALPPKCPAFAGGRGLHAAPARKRLTAGGSRR